MNDEAVEAIRIADKHLPDDTAPFARREALAKDIIAAIISHARKITDETLADVLRRTRN